MNDREPAQISLPRWVLFGCLLTVSALIFLHNLGSPNITLWDEAFHANVIRNLAEHCCIPKLHSSAGIETDFTDWQNNTIWLHKPMLPFYLSAGLYRLFGGSLLGLRLLGGVFALLTAGVIYLIGIRFFNTTTALFATALFSLNPYTNELVHGTEYSGFPDLALVFFVSVAFLLILEWVKSRSPALLRWLGLVVGLAYLCKGGLALAPLAVAVVVAIYLDGVKALAPLAQSMAIFAAVILPERIYWLWHYPVEYRYEQTAQASHLFRVVENHHGNALSYVANFFPLILGLPLFPFAYLSIGWAFTRPRAKPEYILGLWALAYLIPLSLATSKIENFVFAALPAAVLAIPYAIENLMQSKRFSRILAVCIGSLSTYALLRLAQNRAHPTWLAFFGTVTVLLAVWGILSLIHFRSRTVTQVALALAGWALLLSFLDAGITVADAAEPGGSSQAALRESASALKSVVGPDGLVLMDSDRWGYQYLYLMYWSGRDVFNVCKWKQPDKALASLASRKDTYLITDTDWPGEPLARLPIGKLYSLQALPFDDWRTGSGQSCEAQERGW